MTTHFRIPAKSLLTLVGTILVASLSPLPVLRSQEGTTPAPSLASLQEKFAEQRELLLRPINELNTLYEGQLAALRDKVREAGDLDKVLVIDQDVREFRKEDYSPEASFPAIERLREIYRTERERRRKEIATILPVYLSRYLEQLDALSKELTRQDRVQEAVAVREEVENIRLLQEGEVGRVPLSSPAGIPLGDAVGGGEMTGIGFGKRPDPIGLPPSGITDIVSVKYWERDTFDAGWVALRANGAVLTDKEQQVSSDRERIIAYDCSHAGIVMVRDDGTLDSSLCKFAPPEDREKEFTGLLDVTLGHTEGQVEQESAVAIRGDGSLVWWGPATTAPGATEPPTDAHRGIASVVSGRGVYTALKKNGKLVTWKFTSGGNRRATLPSHVDGERFTQVVMSEQHSLGLKTNGEVIAWGSNNDGQCNVPPDLGKCTEVRVLHNVLSLAQKQDGTWVAWGRDYGGIRDQLNGASKMAHVVGRLFPPGEYAYAVWIEDAE